MNGRKRKKEFWEKVEEKKKCLYMQFIYVSDKILYANLKGSFQYGQSPTVNKRNPHVPSVNEYYI